MAKETWRIQGETKRDIEEMRRLLATGVIDKDVRDPIFWAVVTRMFILVLSLVVRSQKLTGKPISFTDDVIAKGRVRNASDLIRFARDSLCHTDSDNHLVWAGAGFSSFCAKRGRGEIFPDMECQYEDDTALFFGDQRVYLQRHLIRAFEEAVLNLKNFID